MSTLHDERDELFSAGLRALRQEQGTLEQAGALERRLLARLGEHALAAKVTYARPRLGGSWALFGVGALVGLALLLDHDRDAQAAAAREPAVTHDVAVAPAAPRAVLPPILAPVAPLPRVPPAAAGPREPRRATPRTAVVPPPMIAPHARPEPVSEDELALLERSRAALSADARVALALAEQHALVYPSGRFAQEREVLAIQALLKQARDAEAVARTQRFLDEHPGSPYALRLREMLSDKPQPAPR